MGLFTFLLLSSDAHNHVDDYSGTLGGVRKNNTKSPHFSSGHKSLNSCTVSTSFSRKKQKNNNNLLTGQWEALDTNVSTVVASTVSLEREFQSLMVRGKKEPFLYCVLVVMSDEAKLVTVGAALAGW